MLISDAADGIHWNKMAIPTVGGFPVTAPAKRWHNLPWTTVSQLAAMPRRSIKGTYYLPASL